MNVLRVHHIAFAHSAESDAVEALSTHLGLSIEHVEKADGFIERMLPAGDTYVQTLESTGPGVIEKFVDKRGSSLHHVAFEVDDIDSAVAELKERGVRMVDAEPRSGGMGTRIAFAHPSSFGGLLVELVEDRKNGDHPA